MAIVVPPVVVLNVATSVFVNVPIAPGNVAAPVLQLVSPVVASQFVFVGVPVLQVALAACADRLARSAADITSAAAARKRRKLERRRAFFMEEKPGMAGITGGADGVMKDFPTKLSFRGLLES
jgi:hypothetical protein